MDNKLTVKDLSSDQLNVYHAILGWAEQRGPVGVYGGNGKLLTVGGYAGTGKSTLLGVFAAETKLRVAYCAFTGRAASNLTRKLRAAGCITPATTIHRLLYVPVVDPKTEEILGWKKRTKLPEADLIVIDEASMVSKAMVDDLKLLGRPILAVGDHGQLPPVMDSGDLMKNPDLRLEKIHRQAEGSPIIQLSRRLREDGVMPRSFDGETIRFRQRGAAAKVIADVYRDFSPMNVGIICWTNKMRIRLNGMARVCLGFKGVPNDGEVVICLKNAPPIYNGMRGVLMGPGRLDEAKVIAAVAFPEEDIPAAPYEMCAGQFNRETTYRNLEELHARGIRVDDMKAAGMLFDFGYAMTCHKAQGSQFGHVVVYLDRREEPSSDDYRKWMYTAVTRSSERLTVLL